MKGLDLSKLQKVSQDDNYTTFKHHYGHEIKVAHKKLSAKMRSELEKIPMAKGGKVEKFADGGKVPAYLAPNDESQSPDVVDSMMAQSTTPEQSQQEDQPGFLDRIGNAMSLNQKVGISPTAGTGQQNIPVPTAAQSQPQDQGSLAPEQSSTPVPQQPDQQMPPMNNSPRQATDTQPMPASSHEEQTAPQTFEEHKAAAQNEYASQDQAWQQDLNNGHIKPQTYSDLFASKNALGKIGTLFGLLVGGAGAGLTHQPNAVMEMMNKEIQNDLNAQTQSKSNAQNFIKMNWDHQLQQAQIGQLKKQGVLTEAQAQNALVEAKQRSYTMAQMQMNRAALHSMVENVNKLPVGSPQRAQAEQTLAMMSGAVNMENAHLGDVAASKEAFGKMLFNNQQGSSGEQQFQNKTNGMRMLGPQGEARAKDLEEKHFPGLQGQASVPLTGEDRAGLNSGMEFDQKLHRFMDWTKNHSGDINPKDKSEGQALAAELQGAYRQATHGGVYKEGEQNFISKLIDSEPTKFFNSIRVMPQLKAIANENQQRVNQLAKSKGFQGYQGAQSSQAASSSNIPEGATGTYQGKPVVRKNGQWVSR